MHGLHVAHLLAGIDPASVAGTHGREGGWPGRPAAGADARPRWARTEETRGTKVAACRENALPCGQSTYPTPWTPETRG